MTDTLRVPGSHDLRRVIGDGEAIPDGEVEGLEERDLLELYRSMVLLRTYDERSVVFHSQGRIGTYAIFWNHEAMQAGWWNPLDYNVASICVPIGTHVPHAAGLAWGKKLRGESACAIAYFGDGATSEGSFHEGS